MKLLKEDPFEIASDVCSDLFLRMKDRLEYDIKCKEAAVVIILFAFTSTLAARELLSYIKATSEANNDKNSRQSVLTLIKETKDVLDKTFIEIEEIINEGIE